MKKEQQEKTTPLKQDAKSPHIDLSVIYSPRSTHYLKKRIRLQQDHSQFPSLTEQHTSNTNDINFLMERYKPDELASYLAMKALGKRPITGHDFSTEPSYQEALNEVYRLKTAYDKLPEDIKKQFTSYVDFIKFADDPKNAEKLIELKLIEKKEKIKPTSLDDINQTLKSLKPNDDNQNDDDKAKKQSPKPSK